MEETITNKEGLDELKILDGKDAKGLLESMQILKLNSGDVVYAGTDKGIDYKDHNEDRVAIVPYDDFVAVVDGMGGETHGELAAQILAEDLSMSPTDMRLATFKARERMKKNGVGTGGALFISARIITEEETDKSAKKFIEISQVGDVKLIVINKEGIVTFESEDQSAVQELIKAGAITADQGLYHEFRNKVTQDISPVKALEETKTYPRIRIGNGDLILLYSDGISDNFTPEEIANKKRWGKMSPKELFTWLSEATDKRMKEKDKIIASSKREQDGVYSDGFKSMPKKDNRSLAIIEVSLPEVSTDQENEEGFEFREEEPEPIPPTTAETEQKEKEALIKRLIEFDAITQKYMHVFDQIEEALSQPDGEKLAAKIEAENSNIPESFWAFRDLGEPYKAAQEEIYKKMDAIEEKRVALAEKRKSAPTTPTPEPLPIPVSEPEPIPSLEPATPEPAFIQEPDRTQEEKNKIVREFLEKGEVENAREFLLREVELKRKNNLEKGLVGKGERIISGISKGIEKWDNLGKAEGWKGYAQRVAKTSISLAMVGIASGLTVEGIAKMTGLTVSSLSGGLTSYLGRRLVLGNTMSALMTKIPDNKKKWVSRAMLAGSVGLAVASGGFIAGGALLASSAIGLGTARLVKKKFNEQISPEQIIKSAQNGYINLDTLERDVEELEKNIEKALKDAEKDRVVVKILEGLTAWTTSTMSLLMFEAGHSLQHHPKIETEQKVENAPIPKPTEPPHIATPTPEPTHMPEVGTSTPTPASTPVPETATPHEPTGETHGVPAEEHKPEVIPSAATENIKPDDIAVVHKGEGIEHVFRRQIENDSDLAEKLGWDGESDLQKFSGGAAHRLAIDKGFVDTTGEHQIGIIGADKVAFEVKLENGHVVVVEKTLDGQILETLDKEKYEFGKSSDNPYEKEFATPTRSLTSDTEATTTPTPEESVKSQDSFHLVDTSPRGFEETNLADSNSPLQPHQPSPEEIKARIIAAMFAEEHKPHDNNANNAVDHDNTEASHGEAEKSTHEINPQKDFTGVRITQEQFDYLQQHPELVGENPFHLHNVELVQVVKVHEQNLEHIYPENTAQYIKELKQLKAKDYVLAGEVSEKIENPLINYLHKLAEITKTKPEHHGFLGLGKAETIYEYMVRALQKAEFMRKLDQLKIEK